MKTVKALKSFSNANFSMYAGEIRELPDALANSYIAEGLVKEYFEPDDVTITPILTEGTDIATATINGEEVTIKAPAGGGGGGVFEIHFAVEDVDGESTTVTCDKTLAEIETAFAAGTLLRAVVNWFGYNIILPTEYFINPSENIRYFCWMAIDTGISKLFYPSIYWDTNKWVLDNSLSYTLTPST